MSSAILSLVECRKILRTQQQVNGQSSENLNIKEVVLEQLKETVGFLGEYYILRIKTEPVFPDAQQVFTYFVKTVPQKNREYRAECERKGVLSKEAKIYLNIIAKLRKYATCKLTADCFLARDDLLVLENLNQNYRQLSSAESYTMSHFRIILRHLATLHAASIAWERKEQFSIGDRFKNELFELLLSKDNDWYITGVKAIIYLASKHEKFQDEAAQVFIRTRLEDLLMRANQLARPSKTLRNVFCHRDLSSSNIFFEYENNSNVPRSCRIVDFGISTYSPPAIDLHFLLYINATINTRRVFYKELTDFYYNELQSQFLLLGIPADEIPRADFELDCRRGHLAGLIMSAICLPLFKLPRGLCVELRSKDSKKFDYWMNVDRIELLNLAMTRFETYKTSIMSIIAELVKYCLQYEKLVNILLEV